MNWVNDKLNTFTRGVRQVLDVPRMQVIGAVNDYRSERARKRFESSYGAPELPHGNSSIDILAAKLGLGAGGELTIVKSALHQGDVESLAENLDILGNPTSIVSNARKAILNSSTGALSLVNLTKATEDQRLVYATEKLLLEEFKSTFPNDVVKLINDGTDYNTIRTQYQNQPELIKKLNQFICLSDYFEAKHKLQIGDGEAAELELKYQNAVMDLAQLTIDPLSNEIFNAPNTGKAPARSKEKDFLEQMNTRGGNLERALFTHLKNEGLLDEINSLANILAQPLDNANHPLLKDRNRAGLRISFTNDLLRKNIYRLKQDIVNPGILGRIKASVFGMGLQKIEVTTQDLEIIYGKNGSNQNIGQRKPYEFSIDKFIVDLYAGSLEPSDSNKPFDNTKAGAVRDLLEVYALVKHKYETATNPDDRDHYAKQQELLGSLIKNAGEQASSIVPKGVYDQIQHVLNEQTGSIFNSLLPLAENAKDGTVKEVIKKDKEKLLKDHSDTVSQSLVADLEYFQPITGIDDPKSFSTVLRKTIEAQITESSDIAEDFINQMSYGNPALRIEIEKGLTSDPSGNGLHSLFVGASAGQPQKDSVEELLKIIIVDDQRKSESKYGEQNKGPIASLCFQKHTKYDEAQILDKVRRGEIDPSTAFLDKRGYERKAIGWAYLFAEIDKSGYSDTVKNEAKEKVLKALGINSSVGNPSILYKAQITDFSQIGLGTANIKFSATVNNLTKSEERTLDVLKAFHRASRADDQAKAVFINSFMKHFTTTADHTRVEETITVIDQAFKNTDPNTSFEDRLKQVKTYIKENAKRPELANSFDTIIYYDEQNQTGFGTLVNDFLKELGFDRIAQIIEKILAEFSKQ
jgi:hypothetical protein